MAITLEQVQQAAPDQRSLTAASKLLKPSKWPVLEMDVDRGLAWGECKGSGSTPYRVRLDLSDLGYKCTCPSRKFPCKHSLALMWTIAERPDALSAGAVPDWVEEWLGRRRPRKAARPASDASDPAALAPGKDIRSAVEVEEIVDPEEQARRAERAAKAAARRKATREKKVLAGLDELETWLADVLAEGLGAFPPRASERCRQIAARLVDAQAGGLATWLDELPGALFAQPDRVRTDWLAEELGHIALLMHAYRRQQALPPGLREDVRRRVGWTVKRDDLLNDADALRVRDTWTVVGVQSVTQVDHLVRHETWLRRHTEGASPEWALLLDFLPVSGGARPPYGPGEVFVAEVVYYPSAWPLRAQLVSKQTPPDGVVPAGAFHGAAAGLDEAMTRALMVRAVQPWQDPIPVLVDGVHVGTVGSGAVLADIDGTAMVPLAALEGPLVAVAGSGPLCAVGLVRGAGLSVLSASTSLGFWGGT